MAPPNEKNSIEQIRQTALIEADGNADKATRLLLDRLKEIPDLKKSLNQMSMSEKLTMSWPGMMNYAKY